MRCREADTSCPAGGTLMPMSYTSPKNTDTPLWHFLIIAILGLAAYSNTFHAPFVFDDISSITQNNIIKRMDNFLFQSGGYTYNPRRFIGYLTFALNYSLGGLDVTGYHIFNLVVHIINAFLVYMLAVLTFRTPHLKTSSLRPSSGWIALFAGLFFVAHPVQTQAVTYITQRLTSLSTFFYLLAFLFYIKFRFVWESEESSRGTTLSFYCLALLSIVLAMKTKEIAFTLPILMLLYELFFFRGSIRRRLIIFVPILLALVIIPLDLLSTDKPLAEVLSDVNEVTIVQTQVSRMDYLMTQFLVITRYLRLLFLPARQNLDYDQPIYHSFFSLPVLSSFLFLSSILLLGAVLYLLARRGNRAGCQELRIVSFGIFWFFMTLSVESSIIPITDPIFEHRMYLPSAWFFTAVLTGLMLCLGALRNAVAIPEKSFVAVLGAVVLVFAGATYFRNAVWRDEVRLWEDVAEKSPFKARAHINLGLAYDKAGRTKDAIQSYLTTLLLDPGSAKVHNNLGTIYSRQGRLEEAMREFHASIDLDPRFASPHYNLGNLYAKTGRYEKALLELEQAVRLDPDHTEAHVSMGLIFSVTNRPGDAFSAYETALEINPDDPNVHFNLGSLYWKTGRPGEATREYRAAIALRPDFPEAYNNLGALYFQSGRFEEAIASFQTLVALRPDDGRAHYNLALLYRKQGRESDALREFQIAERLNSSRR